jgi:hypothetical protein
METAEARVLAEQMARARLEMAKHRQRALGLPAAEALAREEEPPSETFLEQIEQTPPSQTSWYQLNELAKVDVEGALRCWKQTMEFARDDLRSGQWAARAVMDTFSEGPLELARYLALRDELSAQWRPGGGVEGVLIDTMAQCLTEQRRWMETANRRVSQECHDQQLALEKGEPWLPPRVSEAEAVERATAMVERWNRTLLRTLRALRDLRRYAPTINIQNAGQVNIGGQQVNVAEKSL